MAVSLVKKQNDNNFFTTAYLDLTVDGITRTDENIQEALLPYMNKAGTLLITMRFYGGQFVTALVSSSNNYTNVLTLSYYNDVTLTCYRYHATTGWKKYTFTGTVA